MSKVKIQFHVVSKLFFFLIQDYKILKVNLGITEWMNEWCIYIALYCVLLYTQSALQSCGGGGVSPQPPPVCSIHLDGATAATGQRRQCAHHTPATGGEEREMEPIKWMEIIRRPWLTRASGGDLVRTKKTCKKLNLCAGSTKHKVVRFFFFMLTLKISVNILTLDDGESYLYL